MIVLTSVKDTNTYHLSPEGARAESDSLTYRGKKKQRIQVVLFGVLTIGDVLSVHQHTSKLERLVTGRFLSSHRAMSRSPNWQDKFGFEPLLPDDAKGDDGQRLEILGGVRTIGPRKTFRAGFSGHRLLLTARSCFRQGCGEGWEWVL